MAKDKNSTGGKTNRDRRKALKTILAGGGAVATSLSLPKQWTRPIVEAVIVPAHAAASPMMTTGFPNTSFTTSFPQSTTGFPPTTSA